MENNRKPRVLVTYIEAGMGHIVSAKAISEALHRKYGDELEIIDEYICKGDKALEKFETYLIKEVKKYSKFPGYANIQAASMHIIGSKNTLKFVHTAIFSKIKKKIQEKIKEIQPDLILNTHYAPLHFAVELRNKEMSDLLVTTYDPDPNVHGWWDNRGDLFMVNNHFAYLQAIKNKFDKSTIKRVNFTCREGIVNCDLTREELRVKLDIDKDAFVITIADGAYATAKLKTYTNALLKSKKKMTLLVLVGKNDKMYDYFNEKIIEGKVPENITLKLYRFMPNAYELYGASDVFITKAGPNAVQDSLFMGTPVLIDYYAWDAENITQKLFTRGYKCGVTILNKVEARKKIESWIDDPTELNTFKKNCKRLNKFENGSEKAADYIYELLREKHPNLFKKD